MSGKVGWWMEPTFNAVLKACDKCPGCGAKWPRALHFFDSGQEVECHACSRHYAIFITAELEGMNGERDDDLPMDLPARKRAREGLLSAPIPHCDAQHPSGEGPGCYLWAGHSGRHGRGRGDDWGP